MKTAPSKARYIPALTFFAIIILSFLISCHKKSHDTTNNLPYTISGNADGGQMVPPVSDTAHATLTGTFNPANGELQYTSNWMGLTTPPTAAGFYIGAAGASGIAVGNPWTLSAGTTGTTTGKITLTGEQADELLKGNFYYTYATGQYPGGEIRGQVSATR